MKDIYIIGAGGCGREIAWLIERINNIKETWNIKGFIDDNEKILNKVIDGYEVVGDCNYLSELNNVYAVCAIGNVNIRKTIINRLKGCKVLFATLIDPSVIMSERVNIGEGTIICARTFITVDITIGNHVIICGGSTLGHDDVIEDYVTVYPGANISGNVNVGECCEIGTGAHIIQGLNIVRESIIGAGAVVVKEVIESGTYVGNPVRKIK